MMPPKHTTLIPSEMSLGHLHHTLLSIVSPRPIAFASTIDKEGNVNLSPFSYFNVFGINPPLCIFSPATAVRNLQQKDTLLNVREVPEVVINLIDYDIVEQASLASCSYPRGVDEFAKAGLTPVKSVVVAPPYVAEAPAALECRVQQIVETGEGGGAGNLVICIVERIHIREDLLIDGGRVNLEKIQMVGRMGGNYYSKAFGTALFEVEKPNEKVSIGVDALPAELRHSDTLTGADLAKLASAEHLPQFSEAELAEAKTYISAFAADEGQADLNNDQNLHQLMRKLLSLGRMQDAWKAFLTHRRL